MQVALSYQRRPSLQSSGDRTCINNIDNTVVLPLADIAATGFKVPVAIVKSVERLNVHAAREVKPSSRRTAGM